MNKCRYKRIVGASQGRCGWVIKMVTKKKREKEARMPLVEKIGTTKMTKSVVI